MTEQKLTPGEKRVADLFAEASLDKFFEAVEAGRTPTQQEFMSAFAWLIRSTIELQSVFTVSEDTTEEEETPAPDVDTDV